MAMTAAAYARMLKQLLPRGRVWLLELESKLSGVLLAIADELARVEARGEDLVAESDPRTATETLEEWERVYGLPDSCVVAIPSTDAERRLAVTQKVIARGGQRDSYFIQLAAAVGYTATVDDTYGETVARCGRARCGDLGRSADWAHVWRMDVQPPAGAALSQAELECIIERVSPAHTVVLFDYL